MLHIEHNTIEQESDDHGTEVSLTITPSPDGKSVNVCIQRNYTDPERPNERAWCIVDAGEFHELLQLAQTFELDIVDF